MGASVLNIGIVAHVDAGKTTLTENLLFASRAIRTKGSVDKGTAISDNLAIEKQRGISVRASNASFVYKNIQINLIDTPGHADFSSEVEQSLNVLDGAILMLSAVEGVQSHTYALWDALKSLHIPTLIVINKCDRQGADFINVLHEINDELKNVPFPLQYAAQEGTSEVEFYSLWETDNLPAYLKELKQSALEHLVETQESMLESYLEGTVFEFNQIENQLIKAFRQQTLVPVLLSVAKNDLGTKAIMEALVTYFSMKNRTIESALEALVFKIEFHKTFGKLAHIKVDKGVLKSRDVIFNATQQVEEKAGFLKKIFTNKLEDISEIHAGDVGIVSGLTLTQTGDYFGKEINVQKQAIFQNPVLTVQVLPQNEADYMPLVLALEQLNVEDDSLGFIRHPMSGELQINLRGTIQQEVLAERLLQAYEIRTVFSNPTVIYKETPLTKADALVRYTMPKPCWAVVRFEVEPLTRGAGVIYQSALSVDKIARKYQNEIADTLKKSLSQGIKGWEVSDLKITLLDGEDHEMHSRPGDFILATPMALMLALQNAGTQLLEPMYNFEIKAPETDLGSIANLFTVLRGEFGNPDFDSGKFKLTGKVPVATSLDLPIKLNNLTGGKAKLKLQFAGYQSCTDEQGVVRPFKGVNPLNQSQWILHHRGAFKADERKF
jgi:ribosomal protection tetracycline resistance protein